MWRDLKAALRLTLILSVLTGLVYPLVVTGLSQAFFHHRANGSLIVRGGRVVGSELIGQPFSGTGYFWSRPSATTPGYNAGASTGSNLGPTNPALAERVTATVKALRHGHGEGAIPVDLATASASGLDPDISPAAALYQTARVARERGLPPETVRSLVQEHVEARQLGFLGEPRVNVLELNLALDGLAKGARSSLR
jgi:K+-transporting ATPase ATPase C chain